MAPRKAGLSSCNSIDPAGDIPFLHVSQQHTVLWEAWGSDLWQASYRVGYRLPPSGSLGLPLRKALHRKISPAIFHLTPEGWLSSRRLNFLFEGANSHHMVQLQGKILDSHFPPHTASATSPYRQLEYSGMSPLLSFDSWGYNSYTQPWVIFLLFNLSQRVLHTAVVARGRRKSWERNNVSVFSSTPGCSVHNRLEPKALWYPGKAQLAHAEIECTVFRILNFQDE